MHPKMFVLIIKSMFLLKYIVFLKAHPNLSMFVSIILGGRAKAGDGTHFSPPTNHLIHDTSQKALFFVETRQETPFGFSIINSLSKKVPRAEAKTRATLGVSNSEKLNKKKKKNSLSIIESSSSCISSIQEQDCRQPR
jgi:hypothetical protein